jgi:uncharacterized membrane protein YphA (DoxX/SURF4 family)
MSIAGLCLWAGFLTPALSLITAILQIVARVTLKAAPWSFSLLMVSVIAALAVLGPGAYSVDAWLFGRRKLKIGAPPR